MFLLVPAYPGCPGSKAVKRSLLLLLLMVDSVAFSAFTLFVGHQEEHPARCWCGYMSGARCRLHIVQLMPLPSQNPVISPHLIPDWFYLSGTGCPGCPGKAAVKRV